MFNTFFLLISPYKDLIDFNRLTYFCIVLYIIMHLLLFLSPEWLVFCHMFISHINSLDFLIILFLSDEGPTLETLNFFSKFKDSPVSPKTVRCHIWPLRSFLRRLY